MNQVIKRGDRIQTEFCGRAVFGIAEKVGSSVTMITDACDRRITDYPSAFVHSDMPIPLSSRFSFAILQLGGGVSFHFQGELVQGVIMCANYLELEVRFMMGGHEHTRVLAQGEVSKLPHDATRAAIKEILEFRKGPISAQVIKMPWSLAV